MIATKTKENYKGFNVFPFVDTEELYHAAELMFEEDVERVEETAHGFIYKARGYWWDKDGQISGLEYILD